MCIEGYLSEWEHKGSRSEGIHMGLEKDEMLSTSKGLAGLGNFLSCVV